MRKILLFSLLLLTACSNGSDEPRIESYQDCVDAGGEVEYKEPHRCTIFGEVHKDPTPVAKFINYGPATGYYASPVGGGPYPAVLLIHEWWGLNKNMWSFARMLAEQGYVVLAVDLYNGESTDDPERARELATAVREDMDGTFEHLKEAVHWLSLQHNVKENDTGVVGWCFGGQWAYQMAKNDLGVNASVIYYGQFNPEDDLEMMSAQIMGHFGEDDTSIPVDDVQAFRAKLQTLGGDHEIFIYPNEGHGFARELTTPAAKKAWDRTIEFLHEQLQEPTDAE